MFFDPSEDNELSGRLDFEIVPTLPARFILREIPKGLGLEIEFFEMDPVLL